jgi:ribosomal protein S18 acetylase RimI-like enzyme
MEVRIEMVSSGMVRLLTPAVIGVFEQVFTEPPYYEGEEDVAWFASRFRKDAKRPCFYCFVACAGESDVVGFAYGYEGRRGQSYRDALARRLPPVVARRWLRAYFEFTELAVSPPSRRQGIGERLHDSLINSVPHSRAVLTVNRAAIPAIRLYEKKGWTVIEPDLDLWEGAPPQMLLGLDLTKWRGAT